MSAFAWVTLATNDSYSLGALVLAHSLRKVGTAHQLAVMVTPGVTPTMREKLASVFDLVHEVNVLDSNDTSNLALLARPELGITFTKIHCWTLTQYAKCVFMDADTLVLETCDELFDREELSASPDVGWPDCFNSGVFVYRPSMKTYKDILEFALAQGSFDGGDQGLLNMFFSNWATQDSSRRLPFVYNMCSTAVYSYLPAFKQFGKDAKIVHFIGQMKPWLLELDTQTGLVSPSSGYEHLQPMLQQWWCIFLEQVLPKLQPDMGGMAGALANISIGSPRSEQQMALEQHWRRQAWEHGNADYLGKDAFDKIWAKIQSTLQGVQPHGAGDAPPIQAPPPPPPVRVSTPVMAPTEQALPAPAQSPAQQVATPLPIAPTPPPPGDKKTPAPAPNSSPVQPPPTASATPKASKPQPLDANRPSAPPVSQSATACVELSTVTPFQLADQPLSPVKQMYLPSLHPSSVVLSPNVTIPTPPLGPAAESSFSIAKAPSSSLSHVDKSLSFAATPSSPTAKVLTSPPIFPTAIPLPFTSLSPLSATKTPTSTPLSHAAIPSSPIVPPTSTDKVPPSSRTTAAALHSSTWDGTLTNPLDTSISTQQKFTAESAPSQPISLSPAAKTVSPPSTPRPIPPTPTVTDATPPTSPPIKLVTRSPEALDVGNATPPETPPIGSQVATENQSAESAPIPPKRRGGPNKGGKSGQKGKK